MTKNFIYYYLGLILVLSFSSCSAGNSKKNIAAPSTANTLFFDADSAYEYVQRQTEFGPRVPGTQAHSDCRRYLVEKMKSFGADTREQHATLKGYDGSSIKAANILASFFPEIEKRVLLCAHWDSRPWADQDPNPENHKKPILGANDGASGVGVLMEVARQIQKELSKGEKPSFGVDIVLFDAEDLGTPTFAESTTEGDFWCLGAKHWATQATSSGYKAEFGILLDMVGGVSPKFYMDQISNQYAPNVLQNVWAVASRLGYGNTFISTIGGAITDDHQFVNQIAGIPCIDIIDFDPTSPSGFVPQWHTIEDTMVHIDRNSLKIVGETLMNVIFVQ
jgi:hypothetical protein